jgi:hypothetical protein
MSKKRDSRRRFASFIMSVTKYSPVEREQAERMSMRYRIAIRRDWKNRMKIFATEKFQKNLHRRLK